MSKILENSATGQSGLNTYLRLLNYVKPYWNLFAISLIGYLIFAVTQPMFAGLMGYLVDSLQGDRRDQVFWVPLAFIAIILIRGIGSFFGAYYLAKVSNSVVHALRCQVFDKYTLLPTAYFDNSNSGHLLSKITFNVDKVANASTEAVRIAVREGFTVIGLLSYLAYMNWKLSLIFIAIAPLIAVLVNYASKRFRKISRKIQNSMGDITHISSEMINGHRVVRSFGGEGYEQKRFVAASLYNFRQSMRFVQTRAIYSPVLQLIVALALAVLIYLALILMSDASAGEFIAYITSASLIPKPVRQLTNINATLQKGIAAAESLFSVLDEPNEQDHGTFETRRSRGKVEVRNVCFSYPGANKQALQNVSFLIEPGKTLALVGHSGSGKTTLASLIMRFYDHADGQILIDDVEIQNYALKNLRQQIALVTQDVILFNDSIEKNIAYGGLGGADRESVIKAAKAANAMEFIDALPDGLDTLVGENGLKLSGGQRQRLAIARALLKDAPVLILDEATSALDTESEQQIQIALEQVMKGRTTIVIAHRLSTIEKADAIAVMDNGSVVEIGDHQSLLAKQSQYAQLYQVQFRA